VHTLPYLKYMLGSWRRDQPNNQPINLTHISPLGPINYIVVRLELWGYASK